MFFVAGITGRVGGTAARLLLGQNKTVRSLVRDPQKAAEWTSKGVDSQVGDLTDADALAAALEGVEAAFLMQPTPPGVTREYPEAHALTDGIVGALRRNSPPRLVVLSAVGSERSSGLGNITQTQILEKALEEFTFPIAIVRPGSLLENFLPLIARARDTGTFESFFQPLDRAFPMSATVDVGAEVARLLVQGWDGRKIVEVGSFYSPHDLANAIATAIGKPVDAKAIPRRDWSTALGNMGLTPEQAGNREEMLDGFNSGWINFGAAGAVPVAGTTPPAVVFARHDH